MEELTIYTTNSSFEADQIIAAFSDAGIPAYKREHGAGQLIGIVFGASRSASIDIVIPASAENEAIVILTDMGLRE